MNNVKPLYDGYTTYLTAAVRKRPRKGRPESATEILPRPQGLLDFPIWKREEKTLGTRLPKIKPT